MSDTDAVPRLVEVLDPYQAPSPVAAKEAVARAKQAVADIKAALQHSPGKSSKAGQDAKGTVKSETPSSGQPHPDT